MDEDATKEIKRLGRQFMKVKIPLNQYLIYTDAKLDKILMDNICTHNKIGNDIGCGALALNIHRTMINH